MECDDLRLLQQWVLANNRDLGMTFEIVPMVPRQGDPVRAVTRNLGLDIGDQSRQKLGNLGCKDAIKQDLA